MDDTSEHSTRAISNPVSQGVAKTTPRDINTLTEKLTKERSFWRLPLLEELLQRFTPGERFILYILTTVLGLSAIFLLITISQSLTVIIPTHGGTFSEGEIGPARFINPVLTLSQPDEDIATLVYSGLTRALSDGTIQSDIAENYTVSQDGTIYTFKIRDDVQFQDGAPVTSADVVFTVQAAQNPELKSRLRADWEGVAVSAPDSHTVVFKLPHAYTPFLQNTTLGILPKHLWQNVSAEEFPFSPLNTHPIGSGPYKVSSVQTDSTGSATRYTLTSFKKNALGEPNLKTIYFVFYPSETALEKAFNAHSIDAIAGLSPQDLHTLKRSDAEILTVALPRVFGVFYNQNHAPVLADASVREALELAVDKRAIVQSVLGGYGVPVDSPIPPGILDTNAPETSRPLAPAHMASTTSSDTSHADAARAALQKGGWKFDVPTNRWTKGKLTLSLTLATANSAELTATAQEVVAAWRAAGIDATVKIYPLAELNTSVIRPRSYDAVLFGEVVGRSVDLFAFWHSSQRTDPGLNLAMYANTKTDALLAQARATTDRKSREKLYSDFATALGKDRPAIFLYSPEFIYIVPRNLNGVALGALTSPSERFLNVYQWYTDTERVWSIFTDIAPREN